MANTKDMDSIYSMVGSGYPVMNSSLTKTEDQQFGKVPDKLVSADVTTQAG